MKIKTSELSGAPLDWAVAKCEGMLDEPWLWGDQDDVLFNYKPSSHWSLAGPIIERENLGVWWNGIWHAKYDGCGLNQVQDADTPLIAAMRCYVASKLGDEVAVPDLSAGR